MKIERKRVGEKHIMPFTIPSGVITTQISTIKRFLKIIPELGIITTKSITLNPCDGNYEPIIAKIYLTYDLPNISLGFVNAVGLENPGVEKFVEMIKEIEIPEDKFLLASIAGRNKDEFLQIAKELEEYVDGIELNLSCPTKIGYGSSLIEREFERKGKNIFYEITKHVVKNFKKPVFVKLGYNKIEKLAESVLTAKAYGISAINTIGNYIEEIDGYPILSNIHGGVSGRIIKNVAIDAISKIRMRFGNKFKIIGIGGIRNASDVIDFSRAGANFFGIGSALEGLKEREIKEYFSLLIYDLENKTNYAEAILKNVDMRYKKARVIEKRKVAGDLAILKFDISIDASPGQFIFLWLPNVGEKPFSVVDNEPLTLAILRKGFVTSKILELTDGEEVYIRGPYGNPINIEEIKKSNCATLIAGGIGIAGIYLLAKKLKENSISTVILLGAKDKEHLILLDEIRNFGDVFFATEDGSLGYKGLITELFDEIRSCIKKGCYFFNCGRKEMIEKLLPKELEVSPKERIYFSFDHITRCGIGLCGRCSNDKGLRTCVEGPFMKIIK